MGMFDDLIPQQAAPAPVAPPAGMFDDLIPTAGAGSTELVSTTPAQGDQPARVTIGTNPQPQSTLQTIRETIDPLNAVSNLATNRGFRIGAQAVGAGLRDVALMPLDVGTGLFNLGVSGVNKMLGTEIPQAMTASQIADKVTDPISIPEKAMAPGEKLLHNIERFGTQGLAGGALGLLRAPTTAANIAGGTVAPTKLGRVADAFARPYTETPGRAISGDIAGGVGAGAAVNYAQDHGHDSPAAQFFAPLAGGVGGATALGLGTGAATGIGNMLRRNFTAPPKEIPLNPKTGAPFAPGEIDQAARKFQANLDTSRETPAWVANDIRTNAADLGVDRPEMPTSGMLSRNTAMVSAEQRARLDPKQSTRFIERDQNIREKAAGQIGSARDPDADQGAVGRFMEEEPKRLAEARDEEALPLLRQAEQSGVQVDASKAAALIDEKLSTAKRPPVRAALTEARKHLNKVGTEELDTSVSGLYEARKAVNDIIEGRGENPTGRFAKRELIDVRNALDESLTAASPEFGQYLQKYREGSEPVNAFTESDAAQAVVNSKNGDVRNTVKSIMANGVYGGERQAEEIGKLIAQNPEAKDGFRAAVADVLADRVTGTKEVDGNYEARYAQLAKEFKNNEHLLAKVFDPEDMSTLRQAHKLLGYFKEAEKRAVVGSQTAERLKVPDSGELAVRHLYGDLKGGGMIRRFNLLLEQLPNNKASVDEIMNMAWFNPDVAAFLLERPVTTIKGKDSNVYLRRAIAAANAARGENGNGDKH